MSRHKCIICKKVRTGKKMKKVHEDFGNWVCDDAKFYWGAPHCERSEELKEFIKIKNLIKSKTPNLARYL